MRRLRRSLISTRASLVLCAACRGGAAALGGDALARHGCDWTFNDDGEEHTVHFDRAERGPRVSRTLAWSGGDRLDVRVPAEWPLPLPRSPGARRQPWPPWRPRAGPR